jgi:hypothetical protein
MADVQFENQGEEFGRPPQSSAFDLTGAMVRWGLVSTRQQAEYVMIALAVVAFLIAAYFLFTGGGSGSIPPPPPVAATPGQ